MSRASLMAEARARAEAMYQLYVGNESSGRKPYTLAGVGATQRPPCSGSRVGYIFRREGFPTRRPRGPRNAAERAEAPKPQSVRRLMVVRLVFSHWERMGRTLRTSEVEGEADESVDLEMGDFHPGTLFRGAIELDEDGRSELMEALDTGAEPVFWLGKDS